MSLSAMAVPSVDRLNGGQQAADEERVRLVDPEAMALRQQSRAAYAHMTSPAAAGLARSVFPKAVEQRDGEVPSLPVGDRILRYVTANAAQLVLPNGKHAILESLEPIAKHTGKGAFKPLDLALARAGQAYAPVSSDVAVQIPHQLATGVRAPQIGVSMTLTNGQGGPIPSEGSIDGASVFYANAQTDTDAFAKPTVAGFQMDAMLRSAASPEQLSFRVGLPPGARLTEDPRTGGVLIKQAGANLAAIPKPKAFDASQVPVPVSLRVSGNTLRLTVKHRTGSYEYPIMLDPELRTLEDRQVGELYKTVTAPTNWQFTSVPSGKFTATGWAGESLTDTGNEYEGGQTAAFSYETQGESKIYDVLVESSGEDAGKNIESEVRLNPAPVVRWLKIGENYGPTWGESCDEFNSFHECSVPASGTEKNRAVFQQSAYGSGSGFHNTLLKAHVLISQSNPPTIAFNTTQQAFGVGRPNVLYGTGGWLGPASGAFEVEGSDPGLGIAWFEINSSTRGWAVKHAFLEEKKCSGVQCYPSLKDASIKAEGEIFTYSSGLPDGEDVVETAVEDPMSMWSPLVKATLKVDATDPYNVKIISGLPESGGEISAAPHQITVEATDGTKPTPSSGIKSIAVSIDGQEIGAPTGSCSPGECTAGGTWTINGEGLSAGEHKLVITATDNAGNVTTKTVTFAVRNATPVHLGPGSVDPVTGQLAMSATDADIAGVGGISRSYMSRSLGAGIEGPFGPQWGLSLGNNESLRLLPNGNVELRGSSGGLTTFVNSGGTFTAPTGDGNLSLESKEKVVGKGITEYLLKNPAAGTTVIFTHPGSGSRVWAPTTDEGTAPGDTSSYAYRTVESNVEYALPSGSAPSGIAQGPDGNLWFTAPGTSKIGRITPWGSVTEYSVNVKPSAITRGPDENMWFVGSAGTSAIGKISPQGVITEYSLPAGTTPEGITAGPDGNVWFTNYLAGGHSSVGNITSSGMITEYSLRNHTHPRGITVGPEGNLWFTQSVASQKILQITTSGTITEYSGGESQPEAITLGSDGNLWFTSAEGNKIGTMTTTGSVTEYSLPSGSSPHWIAKGPEGKLWFTDKGTSKIGTITTSGTPTEYTLPTGSAPEAIAIGPESSPWYTDGGTSKIGARDTITEPTEELGPVPTGVSCGKNPQEVNLAELKAGCRALTFTYAASTTATGEKSSEWGEYLGRLASVSFTAYNPSSKAMQTTAVAQYSYDLKGRLRSEWDPRISPALKTTYGYDAEGHVIAVSLPGQQPWLIHYGVLAGDPNSGRVLSVTRLGASTALGSGSAPVNTAIPTLSSTSPVVGTTLSVSGNGSWSNSPLAYTYQWEDCAPAKECTPILGAVNQSYTPQVSDAGYALVVQVTAQNAAGTASGVSSESKVLAMSAVSHSSNFGSLGATEGKFNTPYGMAVDSHGNVWVADSANNRVEELSSSGTFIGAYTAGGTILTPAAVAVSPVTGNVYVVDQGHQRVDELNAEGSLIKSFGSEGSGPGMFKTPNGIAVDENGDVWVTDVLNARVEEFNASGTYMGTFGVEGAGNGQFKGPSDVTACGGVLYVVDQGGDRVEKFSLQGRYLGQFGNAGTGNGQFTTPARIACEPAGKDLYVSDRGSNRVQEFNAAGVYLEKFGSAGEGEAQFSTVTGVAVGTAGVIYAADTGHNRVQIWKPSYSTSNPAPTPPSLGTSAIWTVEYRVPPFGAGAPYQMSSSELAKWGQTKDLPTEATAIFPPDEPMGWPAASYKRAALMYLDGQARMVNTVSPNGGISTTEYNSLNEMTRTLNADNRATAMKEGSKSVEVAEALSSKKIYSGDGTQLLETYGPEHKIKLANGTEEETRDREEFSYNEGAPSGETHNALTKAVGWAENSAKKELGKHETTTSYSGENNLGWKLRKPTVTTSEMGGHRTTKATSYEENTGNVTETSESVTPNAPLFGAQLSTEGTGEGQVRKPMGEAFDSSGDLWVVDSGNDRLEEFSGQGVFLKRLGSQGTGANQFESPWGIAINQATGNMYVSDTINNRIEEFSSSGSFVRMFGFGVLDGAEKFETCTSGCRAGRAGEGNGQFHKPLGITIDTAGNVWVVDETNSRVEEFSETGAYLSKFGSHGPENGQLHEPTGIAISAGNLYVTDYNNNRVEEFSTAGAYVSQFGTKGTGSGQFEGPEGITTDPVSGDLYVTDFGNSRVEEFTISGVFLTSFGTKGTGSEQFKGPEGVAVNPAGAIYVADTENSRMQMWEPVPTTPAYVSKFGSVGTEPGQLKTPRAIAVAANGHVYVEDGGNSRIEEFSAAGGYLTTFGSSGTGNGQFKTPYGMAIDAAGNVWVADSGNNRVEEFESTKENKYEAQFGAAGTGVGQFKEPKGIAVSAAGNIYVADAANNRIEEFNSERKFVSAFGFGVSNGEAKWQSCTATCVAGIAGSGNGQFNQPRGLAVSANGNIWVADSLNNRIEELTENGAYVAQFGTKGTGNGQFKEPKSITIDTLGNIWVSDSANNRVQELTAAGKFMTSFGSKGTGNSQLEEPWGIAVTAGSIYLSDVNNNRVEDWAIAPRPGNEGAKDIRTIYYTAAANAEYTNCGGHPEWANLPCLTKPAAQPGVSGLPELPVKTTTYNIWDAPETITETIGAVTRTRKESYDGAGRETSGEVTSTSSADAALPAVTYEYNTETGGLAKQSETLAGKVKTITSVYDKLGQLVEYTDAESVTSKYTYDVDGRVTEMTDGKVGSEGEIGSQTYTYDPTTGQLTKLLDSAAGTFTATYDVEGNILTMGYPNGMSAKYVYNATGQVTSLAYEKTTHCSEKCVWFSDALAFGPKGEEVSQASTLSTESYSYNEEGRLTQTQETPAEKGCITRIYSYNEESARTGTTTREPNEKGECATEGGVVEGHFYDVVGRLLDPGMSYDPLGNATKVPALDAGGHLLTSSFYVDNQVATQEQNGETIEYKYDPEGRTLETKSKGETTNTAVSHYSDPGNTVTWTSESEGKWTRNIPGIDGALDAIQTSGGTPVLQLHDLQGNIVGQAALSETETKLISTHNNTEFGVPIGTPPRYSWLGAGGIPSELGTGVLTSGGLSYVPQLSREIQTEPIVPPGARSGGSYTGAPYITSISPEAIQEISEIGAQAPGRQAERLKAIEVEEAEAIERAMEAAGQGHDPAIYYDEEEAEKLGKKLIAANTLSDVLGLLSVPSAIEEIGGFVIEQVVLGVLGKKGRNPFEWSARTGEGLLRCAKEGTGSCKLKFYEKDLKAEFENWIDGSLIKIDVKLINFFEPAEVYWCIGGTPKHPSYCSNVPL